MNFLERSAEFLSVAGLTLHVETFGNRDDQAILLIMGNSAPGMVWPNAFCTALANKGFCVVRFDQRDTGLSSYVDYEQHPYSLTDLAGDAIGVLDALAILNAHVIGMSQGGVLAAMMAMSDPGRTASLTLLMSSLRLGPKNDAFSGRPVQEGQLSRPDRDYVNNVIALNAIPPKTKSEASARFVKNFQLAAGPRSPFDMITWSALGDSVAAIPSRRTDRRSAQMANNSHHRKAQDATPELSEDALSRLAVPTLILHGDSDPIFPKDHALWAVSRLRAGLHIVPDMGHALDPAFFNTIIAHIVDFIGSIEGSR